MFYGFVIGAVFYIPLIFMWTEIKVAFFEAYIAWRGKSSTESTALFDSLYPYEKQIILNVYQRYGYTQSWRFANPSILQPSLYILVYTISNTIGMLVLVDMLISTTGPLYDSVMLGFFVLLGGLTIAHRAEFLLRLIFMKHH